MIQNLSVALATFWLVGFSVLGCSKPDTAASGGSVGETEKPEAISYSGSPYVFVETVAITTQSPTLNGISPTTCSSSPALPSGLTLDNTSCAISGTPTTTQAAASYTITATHTGGSAQTTISISVNPPPSISVNPTSGPVGTLLTITGTSFDLSSLSSITVNGTTAILISRSSNTAKALVMPGTTTGQVAATNSSGTQSAAFTVTAGSVISTQQGARLTCTGNIGAAQLGLRLALSADGNTALATGSADDSGQGGAWIFVRSGTSWSQQGGKLIGSGNVGAAAQGGSAAISADGDTVIIGSVIDNSNQGGAWIFVRSGTSWSQQGGKLNGSGSVGTPGQGQSAAISADGNTVAIGGYNDNSAQGAVWVFTRTGSVWAQQGTKLVGTGNSGNPRLGTSVGLSADGNTLIAGGFGDNLNTGAVWIFTRSGNSWSQQGSKLVGSSSATNAFQGMSVAISADGNTAIVGGYGDNSNQGASWVFVRNAGTWSQQGAKLVGSGNTGIARQGSSVAISADGNQAIIGGYSDNSALGAAWVFTRSGATWTQQGAKLVGTGHTGTPGYGRSVALSSDGKTALIAGSSNDSNQGAVWVFVP